MLRTHESVAGISASGEELVGSAVLGKGFSARVAPVGADEGQSREDNGEGGCGELHFEVVEWNDVLWVWFRVLFRFFVLVGTRMEWDA